MAFCCVLPAGCDDTEEGPADAFQPQAKQLTGTYQITKATRNGADITTQFDFTAFRLTFQTGNDGTGTYTIENNAPFVVAKNGTWKFDNADYPFAIAFTESGSTSLNITEMLTPVVIDHAQLNLKFSPGCSANVYQYTLTYVAP